MGRSRYKIYEPTHPHFITCTVLHWIPIFTRTDSVQILIDSLNYLKEVDNLKIYAYVILENHLHMIIQSDDLDNSIKKFKSFTAKEILKLLHTHNVKMILDQLAFYKKAHKTDSKYQLWQEGSAPKLIQSDAMMIERINYIHNNPVKRGYVDEAKYWRYSSARDYEGNEGLIEVERFW
ncbi:MAG: transposase [Sulfuricurvum sp.]|uniref:REP-associated tyrosine transposase n=1 Tax=Sulfuricurvum sp. TaxID=2025608 RepID=UPI00261241ED|nr:transposase [Sulfuricurvum sp.]MDD2828937.1 transposase [Sulfuricurvum sp.]MDD4950036.1 transposase [Sulfuricurvum sp.]